jgi:folylpolyglutamate synthase/dihydrofolate synthase
MIASVLREHDIRAGLYTSPHVVDFTERILVGSEPIRPERVVELVDRLKPAAEEMEATFFEIATTVAALHFAEEGVDTAVAEVGLGGGLDATNALDSVLSVITGIAVDHSEILGSDIAAIASEKAGIIRESGAVVTGAAGDALDVIRGVAAARKARFVSVLEEAPIDAISISSNGSVFNLEYDGASYEALSVAMLGRHQVDNAHVAVVALHELDTLGVFSLSEGLLRRGLSEVCCMGRMQVIDQRPTIVADVAHNPDAAEALLSSLPDVFDYDRLIAVVGIMGDKDVRGFLSTGQRAGRRSRDPELRRRGTRSSSSCRPHRGGCAQERALGRPRRRPCLGHRFPLHCWRYPDQSGRRAGTVAGHSKPRRALGGMMASVSMRGVTKVFDGKVVAVNDVSLEVEDREFVVLVGPSGCGKSTLLRMVAGLEEVTDGEILIDNRLVNDVPPKDRDIAMVFQNYALYPHMSVYDNMAFGLRLRKYSKDEIDARVREAADILDISHLSAAGPSTQGALGRTAPESRGGPGHREEAQGFPL